MNLFRLLPLLLAVPTAHASLLVYDGYNYTTGSSLNGSLPSSSTVGLNTATPYAGTFTNPYTVNATSLAFSNLVTTGGSIQSGLSTNVVSARISLGTGTSPYAGADLYAGTSPYTGTLYNSYLVRLTTTPTSSTTVESRVASDDSSTGIRFVSAADNRIGTNANGGQQAGVSYDTSDMSVGTITPSGSILAINTTYLVVSKFTLVGSALTAGQASASIYVMTSPQFDSFIAGGGNDSYLDDIALTIGTGSNQLTARITDPSNNAGPFNFLNGNAVHYLTIASASTIDETRYGSTLADVVPTIPEPTAALLIGSAALLAFRRRK